MITKEEYEEKLAVFKGQEKEFNEFSREYFNQRDAAFRERIRNNIHFKDDELIYSKINRCPCGHGLAYPKDCPMDFHWDCSAILKGIHDKTIKHTEPYPFSMYDIKSEHGEQTTRGTVIPKEIKDV